MAAKGKRQKQRTRERAHLRDLPERESTRSLLRSSGPCYRRRPKAVWVWHIDASQASGRRSPTRGGGGEDGARIIESTSGKTGTARGDPGAATRTSRRSEE